MKRHSILGLAAAGCLACALMAVETPARGQLLPASGSAGGNAPVTFLADQVAYDKTGNIVTAAGHVRAWQSGQTLQADKVVINRATNVATATGHVSLTEPSGQTVFAEQATLSNGMKNAVMSGVAARLADNGRMVANGATRTDDKIDELAKVVYSACDLCKSDPTVPPLWQIKASSATRDLQHKMIEYRDARMEMDGFPVFYTPYLSEPDPSVKRETGLLIPAAGVSSRLGLFVAVPYYIVIDPESDVTLTPILASKEGPAVDAKYRRAFNSGVLNVDVSGGLDRSSFGDSIFANGTFDLNQDWRAGFNLNRASQSGLPERFQYFAERQLSHQQCVSGRLRAGRLYAGGRGYLPRPGRQREPERAADRDAARAVFAGDGAGCDRRPFYGRPRRIQHPAQARHQYQAGLADRRVRGAVRSTGRRGGGGAGAADRGQL